MGAEEQREQKFNRMTQTPIPKLICQLAVPTIISMLVTAFYNMADTFFVGMLRSNAATGAVGVVFSMMAVIQAVGFFFGHGSGNFISRELGRRNTDSASNMAATGFFSALFTGLLICVFGEIFLTPLAAFLGSSPTILPYAKDYLRVILIGAPWMTASLVLNNQLRFQGNAIYGTIGIASGAVLNIGLDLACIILFNMGVFGAAFATVFSQAVAGIGSLIYIMRHYPELRWNKEEGRISAPHCAKLCAMGLPMGLQCSITAIGSVVLQGAVNGLGSDIVAAQTAGGKAAQFLSVPLESIGTAMTTYTSQNMGAKDLGRVNRGVNTALGIGCVYSVASFLILRVLDKPLIGLFLDAGETAIMANAQDFIFWNSVFYIPLAVLIIYRYTIQGLGHSGLAMFAGVAEMIARAMVGFWFVPLWGYFAACIASPVAWLFACFFLIPAYFVVFRRLQKEKQQEAAAKVQ